ncbi:DDE-type integrase/transposase/recombinase, partial [Limnobacter sp.]|uniref:DDE-type integrase/transposase/recombinase n=1 Tax=Limnobacter sp. TaxID=2003368 RepID=UPI002735D08F
MPLLTLELGLVVRRGARTLELVRLFADNKLQLEDQQTGQLQNMQISKFHSMLLSKQLVPVLGEEVHGDYQATSPQKPRLITDLSTLPLKDRHSVERRLGYIKALRKRGLTRGQRVKVGNVIGAIASQLKDEKPPSVSTVLGWMRRYELSNLSPASQLSGNRHRRRNRRIHPAIDELIIRKLRSVYLTKARHTLNHTLDQIRIEAERLHKSGKLTADESTVSLSTIARRLSEFPAYDINRARFGINYARSKSRTSVEGVLATRSMERLECDHTPLNWVVISDQTGLPLGRPTLTIVIDSFSGYVVGIYVSFYGPGLTSVLNVLKNAVRPKDEIVAAAGATQPWIAFGIGETILLDNGLEFHSPQFQLAAWELGMDIEYCRVRTPWLKPKVERFFANLDYFSLTKGRIHKPIPNVLNLNPREDAAITFADFVQGLIRFVVDIYPFELNSRRLVTPFECFKEGLEYAPPPTILTSEEQLNLIAAMSKTLTIGQGGVDFCGLSYSSTEILDIRKEIGGKFRSLVKWNPDDLSYVYLQHPKTDEWLPILSLRPEYTSGLSWIQHGLIRKHAREKHVMGGTVERLERAKRELHELWMNPLARRNRSCNARLAAKFSGVSSNQITSQVKPE